MPQIETIPASRIQTQGLQVRAETRRDHVDDLVELFGDECAWPLALPPLTVFYDGQNYFLADGHHRYQAASEAGCAEIPCDIRQGDKTAALWYAIGANAGHGLRRTNEDKRRAVLMAYQLDPSLSDNAIAKRCHVSPDMANYTLRSLRSNARLSESDSGGQSDPLSDSDSAEPAVEAGTVEATGSSEVETMAPAIAGATRPAPDIRTDARGRRMDVSRIGKGKQTPAGPVDALGVPLTQETAPVFLTALEMDGIVRLLKEAQTRIGAIAGASGAELLKTNALRCEKSGDDER